MSPTILTFYAEIAIAINTGIS